MKKRRVRRQCGKTSTPGTGTDSSSPDKSDKGQTSGCASGQPGQPLSPHIADRPLHDWYVSKVASRARVAMDDEETLAMPGAEVAVLTDLATVPGTPMTPSASPKLVAHWSVMLDLSPSPVAQRRRKRLA